MSTCNAYIIVMLAFVTIPGLYYLRNNINLLPKKSSKDKIETYISNIKTSAKIDPEKDVLQNTCFCSALCVEKSTDSLNSAIHSDYRTSLRPSSLIEPRHPSLKDSSSKPHLNQLRKTPG